MGAEIIRTDTGEHFPVGSFAILGRGQGAGIQIADASISREHASIRRQRDGYWLTDLGSSNGSLANGIRVTTPLKLANGDLVQLGSVHFEFHTDTSPPTSSDDETMFQTQVLKRTEPPVDSARAILLVADLCGFTKMSAELPDEQLAHLINRWYESCRRILNDREATIDKFIGDSVFAYWRTTGNRSRHLALEAARQLASGEDALSEPRRPLSGHGDFVFDCRVGLHLGGIVLGGTTSSDYTALGDAVNLTFRVEAFTRELDAKILATSDFLEDWESGRAEFQPRGTHKLKGIDTPVDLFSTTAPTPPP